jgi:hypothetical protein
VAGELTGAVADPEAIRNAEGQFRRQRNLLAGDERRTWLEARDVTVSEWRGHIRRLVLAESFDEPVATGEQVTAAARVAAGVEGLLEDAAVGLLMGAAAAGRFSAERSPPDQVDRGWTSSRLRRDT